MGSLPLPPNIGGPQTGAQGAMYPSAPGTLPYSSLGPQVVQGISDFIKNFHAVRDADKQRNQQLFQSGVTDLLAGIPIDTKKLAKYAKAAGIPLDLNEPQHVVQGQVDQQERQTQQQAAMAASLSGASAASGGNPAFQPPPQAAAALAGGPAPVPMVGQPQQQPGFMDRLKGVMGAGPIGEHSPGMQWLSQIAQMGKTEMGIKGGELEQKKNLLNVMKAAMQGDPKAVEMATRMRLFQTLGPRDELTLMMRKSGMSDDEVTKANMYMFMGGPEAKAQVWKMAAEMAPRFGGDLNKALAYVNGIFTPGAPRSEEQPSNTFEEQAKKIELTDQLQKQNPRSPAQLTNAAVEALTTPGEAAHQIGSQLLGLVGQHGKGAQDYEQWKQEQIQKAKFHQENLGAEMLRIADARKVHQDQLGMEQLNYYKSKAEQQFNNFWKIRTDPKSSDGEKDSATVGLVDALKAAGVEGVTAKKLGFWGSGIGRLSKETVDLPSHPPVDFKDPKAASDWWKKTMEWFTAPPKGLDMSMDEEMEYRKKMWQAAPPYLKPAGSQ